MAVLRDYYKSDVAPALMKKFEYKNVMQIPKLDKVVINVGSSEARDNAKLIDNIIESIHTCKCFFVITSRPEEIEPFILEKLHRSATDVKAVGVYSHSDKHVLMTVCRRQEANMLRRCIKALDPQAFVIITNSSEIVGNGFWPE